MRPRPWKTTVATLLLGLLTVAAIPESQRSRAAIQRVRPELERALRAKGVRVGTPIFIRIFKEEKELELWVHDGRRFTIFRKYPMCHFSGDLGPKLREGDQQSPEGFYSVGESQLNPSSRFHLSFNIGYPNAYDRSQRRTGSAIMVHGACVSTGCYAMTNPTIEEIYAMADAAFRNGQKSVQVHIFPFRLTDDKIGRHRDSRWYPFWMNLKEGYDFFEQHRRTPAVSVSSHRYVIGEAR